MELLKQLYTVSSPSKDEREMFGFIDGWLNERGIPHTVNEWGITVTKGESETYPCVVAHMDEVHQRRNGKRIFETENGILFGYDIERGEQCGIGADDKNGIWVALKMLERLDALKCAFFIGEEIGCVGSSACDMKFFEDCRFVIQCDRRNGGDFITDAGVELCSKEFVEACKIGRFGYHEEHGLMTDVMTLKERGLQVSAVNLSCGYYNPHTAQELTVFPQLQKCLDFVEWICRNLTDTYPHEPQPRAYGGYFGRGFDDWDGCGLHRSRFDGFEADPVHSQEEAYNFCYNELCYYDDPMNEGPCFEEMLQWWRSDTKGRGCGRKKFRKAYDAAINDLMNAGELVH